MIRQAARGLLLVLASVCICAPLVWGGVFVLSRGWSEAPYIREASAYYQVNLNRPFDEDTLILVGFASVPASDRNWTEVGELIKSGAEKILVDEDWMPEGLDPHWLPLLDRLEARGLERKSMAELFARLGPESYSPAFMAAKIRELYGVGGIGINTRDDDPQLPEGYEQPISDVTVGEYKAFREKYKDELEDIQKKYGVPSSVVVAILLVETRLGSDLGKTPALRSLAGMAATTTPELLGTKGNSGQAARLAGSTLKAKLREKSDWAFRELVALIKYGQDHNMDVASIPGSMYGAIGICQFMPSNIEPYGVDGDGDGDINLFSVVDAMYSAANYLSQHGWQGASTDQGKFRVLLTYNQDNYYAAKVMGVSKQLALAEKGKLADNRNPMYVPGLVQQRTVNPSLRARKPLPVHARIKPLGRYEVILNGP